MLAPGFSRKDYGKSLGTMAGLAPQIWQCRNGCVSKAQGWRHIGGANGTLISGHFAIHRLCTEI